MNKFTLLAFLIICFSGSTNAQFLDKLSKKIEQAAEKTIERKAEQKTSKETGKVFDSVFNKKPKGNTETKDGVEAKNGDVAKENGTSKRSGFPGISQVDPADSYAFDHEVEMQIQSGKELMNVDYHLTRSEKYLGLRIKDKKIKDAHYTVFDIEREAMFTFMESDGQKMKMGIDFKLSDDVEEEATITIKATGNSKQILGYNCLEYHMKGEDMTATIWVTKDTDVRFPTTFYEVKQNQSNNQKWMKDIDGWAMEMEMIDSSKRKPQTIIMKCLSIKKSNFKIDSSEYSSLGF